MKCNWEQRYAQAEDVRVGRECDRYIELGIRLACVAFNEVKGHGRVTIERVREKIQEYIDKEFHCGAEMFSTDRKHNVEHGIERMNASYEAIMSRGYDKKK